MNRPKELYSNCVDTNSNVEITVNIFTENRLETLVLWDWHHHKKYTLIIYEDDILDGHFDEVVVGLMPLLSFLPL